MPVMHTTHCFMLIVPFSAADVPGAYVADRMRGTGEAMPGKQGHGPGGPWPIDPDLPAAQPRALRRAVRGVRHRWDILATIAVGGALGSVARYAVAHALPYEPGQIPWSTVVVNLVGAFLLGLLMVFVLDVWPTTRYLRPFLGVGVLGGFTTFSTYTVDTRALIVAGQPARTAVYLLVTLVGGLFAVWLGSISARAMAGVRPRRRHGSDDDGNSAAAAAPGSERSHR